MGKERQDPVGPVEQEARKRLAEARAKRKEAQEALFGLEIRISTLEELLRSTEGPST